jgi:peptidyl-prolyl cis-trans isomerase C
VARVNGSPITSAELDRETERLLRREAAPADAGWEREARRRALDGLIDRELLWQESRREGIAVPEQDVIRELAVLRKSVASSTVLERALREMDVSPETVRREVERRMAVTALLERRLGAGAPPSEESARRYYESHPEVFRVPEKVRISHILKRIDPRWQLEKKAQARLRMREISLRLRKGEKFAALAGQYSDCPSAEKGGDLGWFARGSLTPQLEVMVFTLPAMVVSDVLEDRYGFHLVMVTGRKAARSVSFAEARPKVIAYLKGEKIREEGLGLARTLRMGANVDINGEK